MNIHQLSVRYLREQDRMLVSINTREGSAMRLWFTRRLTLGLWPSLQRAAAQAAETAVPAAVDTPGDDATRRMMSEFQRDAALQKADFATPYQETRTPTALGAEPLLVTEVQLTVLPTGAMRVALHEKLPEQPTRGMQVELVGPLIHGLVHLIQQALASAHWTDNAAPVAAGEAAVPKAPPRYLN